jgi:HD superfamily phosphohydrolase
MKNKSYEIRDPIHGFISLNELEWDIINQPDFQRLRRIKQLGFTDMVYPGAMHSRFEHSLGVMHIASEMFDCITRRRKEFLEKELSFNTTGLEKDKIIVRLSGLLHDIGHGPFSHGSEELMPFDPKSRKKYTHEQYSSAIITTKFKDIIENHPFNLNYNIKAQDIADLLTGKSANLKRSLLWKGLISSQMDSDRADYLLRDSYHIGVAYGTFDLQRLLNTISVGLDEEDTPRIALEYQGLQVAEAFILARYLMFKQVYFHHTRRAYDHHLLQGMKCILKDGLFPPPVTKKDLEEYLVWDDCKVMGYFKEQKAKEHGDYILFRKHFRKIYESPSTYSEKELEKIELAVVELTKTIGPNNWFKDNTENSWYKFGDNDIPILQKLGEKDESLSSFSSLSKIPDSLKSLDQVRIYVSYDFREKAGILVNEIMKGRLKDAV